MLNFNLVPIFHYLSRVFILLILVSIIIPNSNGQDKDRQERSTQNIQNAQLTKELLPDRLGADWRADGAPRTLNSEQWGILPDGDVYTEYGLQNLTTRIYSDGKTRATVELFEMNFASGAYGLFTFNRGTLSGNRQEFYAGHCLVSIVSDDKSASVNASLVEALKKNLSNEAGQLPFLPSHLPQQNKHPESEKYLVGPVALARDKNFGYLKDIVNFTGGVEIATAEYRNGDSRMSLAIVEYHTPQLAIDGLGRASAFVESLRPEEKQRRILKRIGNYVVEAVNVENIADAQNILSQIKYAPKVYWEGNKLGNIPLEFRPPDPAALEEASQTAMMLIRTFYWIGVMLTSSILLGVIIGGSFFYWRRYRRRKLGIDDLFSDAGGTVRLNLDDYLLQPEESSIKQLGSGKQ